MRLNITAALAVDRVRRTISGTLYRFGEVGQTSAGPLVVRDAASIQLPADLRTVELTKEHDRTSIRGSLLMVDDNEERRYVAIKVADGPEGDAALEEAANRKRAGLSFDIEDHVVKDGVLISSRLAYIGQVKDPAFNSARIDRIAASRITGASRANTEGDKMTEEQRQRLAELLAMNSRSNEEETEFQELTGLAIAEVTGPAEDPATPPAPAPAAPAPAPATAAVPAVPTRGVPAKRAATTTKPVNALADFVSKLATGFKAQNPGQAITAALSDVTSTQQTSNIEAPAWSGELWSGLQYESMFTPLFNQATLTNWEGKGWRWVTKPVMGDYAGDKAAIPSAALVTEPSSYEAARMACGHDFDRKFYDFPNEAFLLSYAEAVREDWAVKLDAKVRAYIVANAVAFGAAQDTLLKAAALAAKKVKRNTRAKATFIAVNDDDFDSLMDFTKNDVPAFLELFNIDPANFIASPDLAAGTVYAGVKQAATVRTLPGSPIRVDAQHLANGGVDSAFFGYWAIEEHHTTGIVKTTYVP